MNRHGSRRNGKSAAKTLTYNDLAFLNEHLANGLKAWEAYSKVHPAAQKRTAQVEAVRVLSKPAVKEHLAMRFQAAGITVELLQARLEWCYEQARKMSDPSIAASVAMDQAKLAGLLVDKHQVEQVGDGEKSVIRGLVADAVRPQAPKDN